MARTKRVTLERNIRRDDFVIEVRVRVAGLPARSQKFARELWETAEGRARVRGWRDFTEQELEQDLRTFGKTPARVAHGSLEQAVADYVPQINVRPGRQADVSHLRAWLAVTLPKPHGPRPLGQWQVEDITTAVVNVVIRQWQTAPTAIRKVRVAAYARTRAAAAQAVPGYVRAIPATSGQVVAPRTIKHRCRVFADMWHTLFDRDNAVAATPIDRAKIPTIPKPLPQPIEETLLHAVLVKLRTLDPLTFVQYAVVSTCWQRPVAVSRAQPKDVNLETKRWVVRSQKGAPAHTIDLGPAAVAAWRAFIELDAWGPIDTTRYGNKIHAAGLPPTIRPYNARHTGAIAALLSGVPLEKVANQLGNDSQTAQRFYTGFVPDPSREVAQKTGQRLAGVFGPVLVRPPTS